MGKRKGCFDVASISLSVESARSAASDPAPMSAANFTPASSACTSGTARIVESTDPLSPMAPAIRFLESGEAICALTDAEPADSPATVTRRGSPPKAAMLSRTQRSAAAWSSRP